MFLTFLLLIPFLALGDMDPPPRINQTDLQLAIGEMRMRSYHGFVILLKILNSTSDLIQNNDVTFLMPSDEDLSRAALSPESLKDFVLSHCIPSPLMLNNLLRFPSGTLVPSNIPNKMINITVTRNSGLLVNNAKIVSPNVCVTSMIRCHGISTTITFDNSLPAFNHNSKGNSDMHHQTNEMGKNLNMDRPAHGTREHSGTQPRTHDMRNSPGMSHPAASPLFSKSKVRGNSGTHHQTRD